MRVVGGQGWGVGEGDGDSEAGQLVEDQDLVGVGAGEPVRRQAPHPLDQPGLGGVTQRVQAGPVQPGAGVAVVDVLADQFVPGGGDVLAQHRQLGADGAAFGLPLGGHPGIQRRPHRSPRSDGIGRTVPVGGDVEQELIAGGQRRHPRILVRGPRRTGGAEQLGDEHRFGARPGDQPGQTAAGEPSRGETPGQLAGLKQVRAQRLVVDLRRLGPAARTTGCSPPAHPLDGPSVQPHPEPLRHLLGQLRPGPACGADELHDLRAQFHRAATAAPLVEQPGHARLSNDADTR